MEEGQKATVKLNALLEIQERLETLKKVRDREPEKRWQAHYDLMLAQTVAFEVKAYEYRALMASIVKNRPTPKAQPGADLMITWVVDHAKEPLAPTGRDRQEVRRGRAAAQGGHRHAIPRPPGPTWRRTPSTAASRSSSTSGTTTRSTTTAAVRAQVLSGTRVLGLRVGIGRG